MKPSCVVVGDVAHPLALRESVGQEIQCPGAKLAGLVPSPADMFVVADGAGSPGPITRTHINHRIQTPGS